MTDHAHTADTLPTATDASGGIDFPASSVETAEAPRARQRPAFGFGDGGKPDCPLFLLNPEAEITSVIDFCDIGESALDDLLNEAVTHGGIEGDRTWLVEMLVHATRAASDRLHWRG